MSLMHEFDQYEILADTRGELSDNLSNAIKNSWNARTRSTISCIRPSDQWDGRVYAIEFNDQRNKPPSIGSYVRALIRHGWGYLYYEEDKIHVAPIVTDNDNYSFMGRENKSFDLPQIRKIPDIEIDSDLPFDKKARKKDQKRIQQLKKDISKVWPSETIESIKDITYSTGEANMYIINTDSNTVIEKNDDGNHKITNREVPDSPLGKHVDALLSKGWAISTIKSSSLFVGRINRLINGMDTITSYKFEGKEKLTYIPKVCEICEGHEYNQMLVTDTEESEFGDMEFPVYTHACEDCAEDSEHPTTEEYRNESEELDDKN